ncbi:hypothetical protein KR76_00092 [Pimelobacter simplex]|uniref:Uncharacterized protein n=1 Tax=Nocardioides simplex TaxID=2045 RepID=A0A0C5WYI7_NOCSI|nr:hypothetical protein KR76_00092 [Pimelobacter simplex]
MGRGGTNPGARRAAAPGAVAHGARCVAARPPWRASRPCGLRSAGSRTTMRVLSAACPAPPRPWTGHGLAGLRTTARQPDPTSPRPQSPRVAHEAAPTPAAAAAPATDPAPNHLGRPCPTPDADSPRGRTLAPRPGSV